MILNCTACSAKYMVPSEAIGDAGRDVRCKKCGHSWFQKPERTSLDELINKIQSDESGGDDISFGDEEDIRASLKKPRLENKTEFFIFPIFRKAIAPFRNSHNVAGGLSALAIFLILLWGGVMMRSGVIAAFPSFEKVYTVLGLSPTPYASVNPEESLVLDRLDWKEEGRGAVIKGNVINLTSKLVKLPHLQIAFVDGAGKVIRKETLTFSQSGIKKEVVLPFVFPLPSFPRQAVALQASFSE